MSTSQNIDSNARVDGSISADFIAASGKQNLMESFDKWLIDIVRGGYVGDGTLPPGKDFYWSFDQPLAPMNVPAIGVVELGLFNLGAYAMDENLVAFTPEGKQVKAVRNQTLIEITCYALDSDTFGGSTKKVRQLRDRVVFALEFAGTMNDDETGFVVPHIRMRDFSRAGAPVIGKIMLDKEGNAINEKFLIDPVNNQLKKYRLLVRILYDEYKDPL